MPDDPNSGGLPPATQDLLEVLQAAKLHLDQALAHAASVNQASTRLSRRLGADAVASNGACDTSCGGGGRDLDVLQERIQTVQR